MQPNNPPEWEAAPAVPKFDVKDLVNQSIIYIHAGIHTDLPLKFGTKDGCRGTIVVLTGRQAGEVYDSQLILSAHMVLQFRQMQPGQVRVGRVVVSGKSIAMETVVTDFDKQQATAWWNAHPGEMERLAAAGIKSFPDDDRSARQMFTQQGQQDGGQVQSSPQAQPWIGSQAAAAQMPTLPTQQVPPQSEEPPF